MTQAAASPEIVLPVVHLNGTSREELVNQLCEVYAKLGDAYEALKQASPNGRDYYLVPGRLKLAEEQHRRRFLAIDAMRDEIQAQIEGIDAQ